MDLRTKQLKALEATRDIIWKKWEKGETRHRWNIEICPLCKEFYGKKRNEHLHIEEGGHLCSGCPFSQFYDKDFDANVGCQQFQLVYDDAEEGISIFTPIEETISMLDQIIAYWKEKN